VIKFAEEELLKEYNPIENIQQTTIKEQPSSTNPS
jgi:hypothetical protein